jgi:cellulose synthase/poly-beta-1,6-N-acetylglucosamine synthase-like glycosyltransferase
VPAYNEQKGIAACVRSLAAVDYSNVEIVVVDDGSTDDTAAVVAGLALPNVRLLRQPNAGKPAALNKGILLARHDILILVDGDTILEPDGVRALIEPFAEPHVGAVSGNTKVGNRRGLLGRWQHIEYVIGLNLDRRMFDVMRCMPTLPGAIGAFRRQAVEEVGGVSEDTVAEDTDLTMAICRAGWRVLYAADARAWTEAPASMGQLWRQRYRWCYGTLQAVRKHRGAIGQSGSAGKLGRRGLRTCWHFTFCFRCSPRSWMSPRFMRSSCHRLPRSCCTSGSASLRCSCLVRSTPSDWIASRSVRSGVFHSNRSLIDS